MKTPRCAIYTRKSTEEGLEQGFNSLHAQREACAAYVLSQAGEGWAALASEYDDGGFSGGNIERPALKRLLADIGAGLIDIVVVYKVDRLTRSLGDFSKIVDAFDAHNVSFVSVTQSFNTTSSMGRLTLNMLLSFAQFEREVTGERIRDKIAASKAKGLWMGGLAPLGYDGVDRKLVINPAEALTVRALFARYLELGSVVKLAPDLASRAIVSKVRLGKDGTTRGGAAITRGALYHLLSNPVYLGAIRHRDRTYPDAHPAIVDAATWDAVQALLARNDIPKPAAPKLGEGALLKGLIFDDLGNPMQPSHTVKSGRRYHYYITHPRLAANGCVGSLPRIGAAVIDAFVADRIQSVLRPNWRGGEVPASRIRAALTRVVLGTGVVTITLDPQACLPTHANGSTAPDRPVVIDVPIALKHRHTATLIAPSDRPTPSAPSIDPTLVRALSLSRRWRRCLESGEVASTRELAQREGLCHRHTGRLLPLAYLAPDLVDLILEGRQPRAMTLKTLTERPLPRTWDDQRALFHRAG